MRLIVVHHHYRPGGVRRVIELGVPHVVRALRDVREVVLVGEAEPETAWLAGLRARLAALPVRPWSEPGVGYWAEQRVGVAELRQRLRAALRRLLGPGSAGDIVWAHNLGLGRNVVLAQELGRACRRAGCRWIVHHHDWWFDHRWERWPELRRGAGSLAGVAQALMAVGDRTMHVGINREDVALLSEGFGKRAAWLPNPVELAEPLSGGRGAAVKRWVTAMTGAEITAPIWILPCRFLRRKNVAEAILLARWLRPEAWMLTTGGPSSEAERPAFERLGTAARAGGWRVRLGVLAEAGARDPGVLDLMGASEAVCFTSLIEGFGLPYLEAAAAGRPLVARALPNVIPDLKSLGFRFPTLYGEVLVPPGLFDLRAEVRRQEVLYRAWRMGLPQRFREWAGQPWLLERSGEEAVPFSRLTLTAQLEVLGVPAGESWDACLRFNRWLAGWRERAAGGALPQVPWPAAAVARVSGPAYGRAFARIAASALRVGDEPAAEVRLATQEAFVKQRLGRERLFPLLWSKST